MPWKNLSGIFLHFSRIIAGIVFIYSGFVKGIDPLGSAYKFTDYFVAFNMESLEQYSLILSVLLSAAEMLIGILLLAGIKMVMATWGVFLFMGFFTILTLIIALTDPVADCGCFGDAIILTNWETFWKNVVLMGLVVNLFINRKKFKNFFRLRYYESGTVAIFFITILAIFSYSYRNLPVIDFRPFSIGSNIIEKMSVPPDAPADEYEITLYYTKDGETRAFSVDSIPDSSWEWVRTESILISPGYEPPITNFRIESITEGIDHTYDILEEGGYTFVMVAYDLDRSSRNNITRINQLAEWSSQRDIGFICLTSSPVPQIDEYIENTGATYDFYHTDEITLKTIIRSNPGLLLLKQGTIIGKWHNRNIPHADEVGDNLLSWSFESQQTSKNRLITIGYILSLLFAVTLLNVAGIYLRGVPGKIDEKKMLN